MEVLRTPIESPETCVFQLCLTVHRDHCNDPHVPVSCPCCKCLYKDNDHILQCPDSAVEQWRQQVFPTIKKAIQKTKVKLLDNHLLNILHAGIHSWLSATAPPNPADYRTQYCDVFIQQNAIRWGQVLKGIFSHKWWVRAECYYWDNALAPKTATAFSIHLLQTWLDIWKSCNKLCCSKIWQLSQTICHH